MISVNKKTGQLPSHDYKLLHSFTTLRTAAQLSLDRRKLKFHEPVAQHKAHSIPPDSSNCSTFALLIHSALSQVVDKNNDVTDYPLFALAEAIYMSWFTFELLVRLVSYVQTQIRKIS